MNQCFSRHKIVSEGYIVEVSYESNPADKHLLVAVYGTGQLQGVFNEAVQLIAEQFNNHCIVDFIDLSHSTDLQPYFHEQKPFYKRA